MNGLDNDKDDIDKNVINSLSTEVVNKTADI